MIGGADGRSARAASAADRPTVARDLRHENGAVPGGSCPRLSVGGIPSGDGDRVYTSPSAPGLERSWHPDRPPLLERPAPAVGRPPNVAARGNNAAAAAPPNRRDASGRGPISRAPNFTPLALLPRPPGPLPPPHGHLDKQSSTPNYAIRVIVVRPQLRSYARQRITVCIQPVGRPSSPGERLRASATVGRWGGRGLLRWAPLGEGIGSVSRCRPAPADASRPWGSTSAFPPSEHVPAVGIIAHDRADSTRAA